MNPRIKFVRFCIGILAYLLASTALLKWLAGPRLPADTTDTLVAANVVIMLIAWIVAFWTWGPVRGHRRKSGD